VVECGEDVGTAFITDGDAAEACKPGQGSLDHPSVPAEALAALDATSGDARDDRSLAQRLAAVGEVVSLVGVQLGRSPSWPARTLADCRHGIDHRFQQLAVVPVGGRDFQGERDAIGIDEDMPLGARLAAVRRVRAGLITPLFAGTAALSTAARSQLMALA
jgi:hypothetical protein